MVAVTLSQCNKNSTSHLTLTNNIDDTERLTTAQFSPTHATKQQITK